MLSDIFSDNTYSIRNIYYLLYELIQISDIQRPHRLTSFALNLLLLRHLLYSDDYCRWIATCRFIAIISLVFLCS